MTKSSLFAVLGGLIWTSFHVWLASTGTGIPDNIQLIAFPALGAAFFFFALLGFYRSDSLGTAGKGSALVTMIGLGIFTSGAFIAAFFWNGAWLIAILGELIISGGLVFFSLAAWGEKFLRRFNALPLLMTLVYIPSWMSVPPSPPFPSHFEHWLAALYGVGWVLLGVLLR